jgi:hypothetical protein
MRRILRLDFSFLRNGFAFCASIPQSWGYVSQSEIAFHTLREWFFDLRIAVLRLGESVFSHKITFPTLREYVSGEKYYQTISSTDLNEMKHDAKVTTNYYFLIHIVFKFRRPSCKATSGHRLKSPTIRYIVFNRVSSCY